jgi:hypothetical protein
MVSVLAQTCSIGTPTEENRSRGLRLPKEVQSLCHRWAPRQACHTILMLQCTRSKVEQQMLKTCPARPMATSRPIDFTGRMNPNPAQRTSICCALEERP